VLELAVIYAPQQRPGLRIELLIEDRLVLVTSARRASVPKAADYVLIDWGPEFAEQHHLAFPQLANPATTVGLGPLGLAYILEAGGAGYFRASAVRKHLVAGSLRVVEDAPVFLHPAYAVYAETADPKILTPALTGLRHVAAAESPAPARRRKASARR
jgi:hypothetical protein